MNRTAVNQFVGLMNIDIGQPLASRIHQSKIPLPTTLDTNALGSLIHRRAIVSAQVSEASLLDRIMRKVTDLLTAGEESDPATARLRLSEFADEANTNVLGDSRLNLILRTSQDTAQGYGQALAANQPTVVDAFPGWELFRLGDRLKPRDWDQRWTAAAEAAGDEDALSVFSSTGRFCALKSSGIWQALGDAEGALDDNGREVDDGLGNPFPPFAFNSGMWTQDISYEECVTLGLLEQGETPEALDLDEFDDRFSLVADFEDATINAALRDVLPKGAKVKKGVLTA